MRRQPLKSKCPTCHSTAHQIRNGRNPSGSFRAKCKLCARSYTIRFRRRGYSKQKVREILFLYVNLWSGHYIKRGIARPVFFEVPQGNRGFARQVARFANVHHQTVLNWVKRCVASGQPLDRFLKN